MIAFPRTKGDFAYLREFLALREIFITPDSHLLVWIKDQIPVWVVAMNGWTGQTCQMSFANARPGILAPRSFTRAVFDYAFNTIDRRYVFVTIKGDNSRSLRFCTWLGFEESSRVSGAYKDGADLVLLTMAKAKCRWIGTHHGQRLPANS